MAEGTVVLPPDGAGKALRTQTNAGIASGAHQQVFTAADAAGAMDGNQASGSLGALNAAVTLTVPAFASSWVIDVRGTFVGTIAFEVTLNGTDWGGITGITVGASAVDGYVGSTTAPGMWKGNSAGYAQIRARMSAYTSGTATVTIRTGSGTGMVFVGSAPPTGRNTITKVTTSTFRIPGQAASPHNLFALHNTSASLVNVGVRRLTIQVVSTAASTVLTTFRTWRTLTVPTGGTALTKFTQDSTTTSAATVTVLGAASADGTAGTAITHAAVTTTPLWQQFQPVQIGTTGYVFAEDNSLIPNIYDDEPLIIRPGQTCLVAAVTNSLTSNHYIVQCMWEEYT